MKSFERAALSTMAVLAVWSVIGGAAAVGPNDDASIRPFKFHASDNALADLHRRIGATNWLERETVADTTQGVRLATMQKLAHYWSTEYDRGELRSAR